MRDCLEDLRSPAHTKHALVLMVRQRVYQIAAGYEDCNDADFLRIDPALRLAIGKDHKSGASQSMLSRLENDVLGNAFGLEALDAALARSTDALLRRKNKAAADYRCGFYRGPCAWQARGCGLQRSFWQELLSPLVLLYQ